MIVSQALREAAKALEAVSATPRLDAELLMAHALSTTRSEMLLRHMNDPVPGGFAQMLERRRAHEPVAYILGREEFFGLTLKVTPDVLIPRSDSEVLVERALACKPDARSVLDCGTGTGALLLAVLNHLADAEGVGIDRSARAVEVARENAEALGLARRAKMVLADWDKPGWSASVGGPFDLVLANPPYVETSAGLEPSVREFEPAGALFAGREGLDAYRRLIPQLPALLAPGGIALVEIGASQAEAVGTICSRVGLVAKLHRDLANRPRVMQLSTAG